jgi:hypothetical protein
VHIVYSALCAARAGYHFLTRMGWCTLRWLLLMFHAEEEHWICDLDTQQTVHIMRVDWIEGIELHCYTCAGDSGLDRAINSGVLTLCCPARPNSGPGLNWNHVALAYRRYWNCTQQRVGFTGKVIVLASLGNTWSCCRTIFSLLRRK